MLLLPCVPYPGIYGAKIKNRTFIRDIFLSLSFLFATDLEQCNAPGTEEKKFRWVGLGIFLFAFVRNHNR
jgi:hypothetical protein